MIPMSGITAGGNNGEINTSALTSQRQKEMEGWAKHKISFTNAVCFPVANFTALP